MADQYRIARQRCDFGGGSARQPEQACVLVDGARGGIAIFGDSHADAITPAFEPMARATGRRLIMFATSSCAPITGFRGISPLQPDCRPGRERILAYLRSNKEIDTVVLAARWTERFAGAPFDNGGGGVTAGASRRPPDAAARDAMIAGLRTTISVLAEAGKRVILVYPIPEAGWDVPRYLAKARQRGAGVPVLSTDAERIRVRDESAVAALDRLGSMPGLVRAYPASGLCGATVPGRCLVAFAGRPLYFDDNHLTAEGARRALPRAGDLLR
jgi:hypothetical protein